MTCAVLNSSGTGFATPLTVLNSSGTGFLVPVSVLDSDGNSFIVCVSAQTNTGGGEDSRERRNRIMLQTAQKEETLIISVVKAYMKQVL